jgi:RNA polymerase sigma-70 factor (ECF subfamily)
MQSDKLLSLINLTAQGDKKAFAQLYDETSSKLFAISLKMLVNRAQAEEVLQDAFVKIWHNSSAYNSSKGTVISWMISIVRYRCLDVLRYNKVRKEETLPSEDVLNLTSDQDIEVEYNSNNKLVECIDELEIQQKQVIHLAYYRGLSHKELVSQTSLPLGTIKSWIRRGLQQLQRCLSL